MVSSVSERLESVWEPKALLFRAAVRHHVLISEDRISRCRVKGVGLGDLRVCFLQMIWSFWLHQVMTASLGGWVEDVCAGVRTVTTISEVMLGSEREGWAARVGDERMPGV